MDDTRQIQRRRPPHHPPVERVNEPTVVHVSVCTRDRRCVLACDAAHALCRSVWQEAHFWRVGQYVIMPDHIHLFCSPGRMPATSLKQWVEYWKSQIAAQWPRAATLGADGTAHASSRRQPSLTSQSRKPVPPGCVTGGPTSVSAAARAEQTDGTEPVPPEGWNGPTSRLRQEATGGQAVSADGRAVPGVTTKLWQRDFWDTQMRGRDHFNEKLAYVRMNPVRKGLVTEPADWPYQGEVFRLVWL